MYFIIMYAMAIYQNIREVYKTWKGIYAQSKSKGGNKIKELYQTKNET